MKRIAVTILLMITVMVMICLPACTRQVIRVISEENPPYNFTDETGNITGQSTEVVRRLISKTGSEAKFEIMPWSEGYELVQKEPGTMIFSTVRMPQRENLFKWVGPIGTTDYWFYSRQDVDIKIATLDDARKVKGIAVYKDDSNHIFLQSEGFTNLDVSTDMSDCIRKLVSGQVDLWLGPAEGLHFVAYSAKVNPAELQPVKLIRKVEFYIAFNKNTPDATIQAWQKVLDDMKKSSDSGKISEYQDIVTSYALPRYATSTVQEGEVIKLAEQTADDLNKDAGGTIVKINAGAGPYLNPQNRALYVFVFDKYVTLVANASNPTVIGRNFKGVPDMAGKLFRDAIVENALKNGSGWEDYVFTMPGNIGLYYKTVYYKLVTGSDGKQYIVCAGRYKDKK